MTYQNVTGTLSPEKHPGSYNGQDAYNDMLVTERERERCLYILPKIGEYKKSDVFQTIITHRTMILSNLIIERAD